MFRFEQQAASRPHLRRHTATLFLAMFAAQTAFLALVTTLPQVGDEFHVRAEVVGQLGAVSGLAGLAVAFWIARFRAGASARPVLLAGLFLLTAGGILASLAGSIITIVFAQLIAGAAAAAIGVSATAAAYIWPAPEQRAGVLAWVVLGSPAAWIIGSPVIGVIAERDWRWVWLLPVILGGAVVLALQVGTRPAETSAHGAGLEIVRSRPLRRWVAGELLAFTGWNGVLVYASALFAEEYGLSARSIGLLLALVVVVYFPATLGARRYAEEHSASMLNWLALAAAPTVLMLGAFRPGMLVSALALAVLAAINGARGLAGGVRGQQHAPGEPMAIAALRISIMQGAGITGAALGGAALALGGWPALGITLSAVYLASAVAHGTLNIAPRRSLRPTIGIDARKYGNPADASAQARI